MRPVSESAADRTIAGLAKDGRYVPKAHMDRLRSHCRDADTAADIVEGHVRRLEALRRAGIVERIADGLWRVPADIVEKDSAYDRKRLAGIELELHSHLPIEQQVRAIGATWLDRRLLTGDSSTLISGLVPQRPRQCAHASLSWSNKVLSSNAMVAAFAARDPLDTLREREVAAVAHKIHRERGLVHRAVKNGGRASGIYRRSLTLASGRFPMLSDGLGFALVPWRAGWEDGGYQMTSVTGLKGD